MRRHISSLLPVCAAAFVTFCGTGVLAAAKDETYSAYAVQNQVTDAILSRDGTTFMTFATERGKPVLRGWRIAGSDATQIGRIELKDLRTPTRSTTPYPFDGINKDFASFKKSFALSPTGDRIARLDCGHVGGLFADECSRLILMDWRGKAVASIKDTKKETDIVPGARPCGIEFSPDGQRLYLCTEGASFGFSGNQITYHDEYSRIHAFDAQLKQVQVITLGPTERASGTFPGRAQIEGFSISSDNTMLAYGYAYSTTNATGMSLENATQFDKSNGTQVWRVNLNTGATEYHYSSHRPADAETYAKDGNYLDRVGGRYAALVGKHLLTGYDHGLDWEGEVFGEAKRAKSVPTAYVSRPASSKVSDDGRILFGHVANVVSPRWWIVGPGAGPVFVRDGDENEPAKDERVLATTLMPGSYASLTVTNRKLVVHDAPAEDLITTASKYAEAVDQLEAGFTEAGVKGIKGAVSAMPPGWAPAASRQLHSFSSHVMRGERNLSVGHMGELLRHSALTFHARYKQDNALPTLESTISLWNQFGLHAAMAGNPIVVRQAADKLKPLIDEWQTRKAGEKDRDAYNVYPLLLDGLAVAIEKSPDGAYDHLLAGGKLNEVASTYIRAYAHAFRPLYSNLTKLAYLTNSKIEDLESRKPKSPQPPPAPYPDADGKLIPALTVFQPGATTAIASQPEPDSSAGAAPPPTAPGGQVLD
ncbi:MAG: hypothetical protein IT566_17800 [Rhodospirillaceae bacterium]|nr:hypothetical protein [Rhodospirillaceae bacterium]